MGFFFMIPFLIQTLFYLFQLPEELLGWIQLSASWERLLYRPWTLITYSFLHADFFTCSGTCFCYITLDNSFKPFF